jgi:hypothetical protein
MSQVFVFLLLLVAASAAIWAAFLYVISPQLMGPFAPASARKLQNVFRRAEPDDLSAIIGAAAFITISPSINLSDDLDAIVAIDRSLDGSTAALTFEREVL